jgi:hypothetical protein
MNAEDCMAAFIETEELPCRLLLVSIDAANKNVKCRTAHLHVFI